MAEPVAIEAAVAPYNSLLLVDSRLRSFRDIRACENPERGLPPLSSQRDRDRADPKWTLERGARGAALWAI